MPFSVLIFGAGQIAAGYDNPLSKAVLTHAHAVCENRNFNLLGFYDIDKRRGEVAAQKWSANVYDEPVKADVIAICTSDKSHPESLRQAIALQPKIIILEKPIPQELNSIAKILEISIKTPIQVNFTRRYVREFQDLALKIKEYGNFITGNGLYGKGFIHNGSHMLDLLRLLVGEIENIEVLNTFSDFYPDDPTKTVRINFNKSDEFFMQGIDCRNYTVFELDLCFENARIRVIDSGYKIQIYKPKKSDKFIGYSYLHLNNEINTQMDYAMQNLYQNVHNFLSYGDQLLSPIQNAFVKALYD
ncbi:hypothetical protein FACS1894137_01050 [Spirochaetia bacterium]|nr:hypothetical protein FACS1894137_01050 [Spirochaetia bacterium]